jgi:hypothetical protein
VRARRAHMHRSNLEEAWKAGMQAFAQVVWWGLKDERRCCSCSINMLKTT